MRIFLLLLLPFGIASQNVVIKGFADSSYAGRVVTLSRVLDHITGLEMREEDDTVAVDGTFELECQTKETRPVAIRIGKAMATLYIQPDYVYAITFPALDPQMVYDNRTDLPVTIGIIGKDSTELNALIFDFESQKNKLLYSEDGRFLSRAMLFKRADSLQQRCDRRYAGIKNDYFKNYVKYAIASLNASLSRGEKYLINGYLINKPILYTHHEYMQFFNTTFSGYAMELSAQKKGQTLYNIVNQKGSCQLFNDFLKTDRFLKNDTLRELVILRSLWDFYFSPEFNPSAVSSMIAQVHMQTNIPEHRTISNNMLTFINRMQPGSPAPVLMARSREGTIGTLENFKGHWVYLNFFSTKNPESLKEMAMLSDLRKNFRKDYGDQVVFLSVCLDDSMSTYQRYLKNNPKLDWAIWFANEKSIQVKANESWHIAGTEAYFLISKDGYIVNAPALSPSGGIKNKLARLFKAKRRNNKTGIR